jgi:hypothetical protein
VSGLGQLPRWLRVPVLVVLVLVVWYVNNRDVEILQAPETGAGVVEQAYAERRSGVWLEIDGRVTRLLADDNEGSRHQRFILTLDSGHTVLVAHNIDLARRVPVHEGGEIELRGRYEWNDRGGVIHWTHHDPDGSDPGGWVRHAGTFYR